MCVLLFDAFKHLLLTKLTFSKLVGKVNFSERKSLALKSKKVQARFGKTFILALLSSSTRLCLRFLLNCFVREIKGFYESSLGNEVDFRDVIDVSPNILAKN